MLWRSKSCLSNCSENNTFAIESSKTCVDVCPEAYSYKDGNECVSDCSIHRKVLAPNKTCINECNYTNSNYPYEYKGKCVGSCPIEAQYTIGEEYKCVNSCSINYPFVSGKKCVHNCIDEQSNIYQLEDEYQCVSLCNTNEYPYILKIDDLHISQCVAKCEAPFPYIDETGKKCVNKCENNDVVLPPLYQCYSNCNADYKYKLNGECTNQCDEEHPYHYKNECVEDCKSHRYWIYKSTECVPQC